MRLFVTGYHEVTSLNCMRWSYALKVALELFSISGPLHTLVLGKQLLSFEELRVGLRH